jgi:hypothetical protein
MFFLALAFLVILAGVIHRFPQLRPDDLEVSLIVGGLGIVWLIFVIDAALRFFFRDRVQPTWKAFLKGVACAAVPPVRVACRSRFRPDEIWLPFLG